MKHLKDIDIIQLYSTQSDEFMEILWTALNPDGVSGRTRSILNDPAITAYYENWGKPDDIGYAAVKDGIMIGAIWSRIKDCVTAEHAEYPELGIGVLPEYQDAGIGSALLRKLIKTCRGKYAGIRLGVNEKADRVLSFYWKFGFMEYDKHNGSPQLQLTFG
ncbi:MAG: GNAT family N-acetyltransferase [Desulfobacteraceae bacterium]|nr:GNAT family N-acetyltransferase [Desulfobacteraceae bacterium]MBU4001840.1 GNAT family N-acetyltransferase [Pseudomonadota bacterium]MBU4053713.1 GNAT family N-acetyltransferase [Pseudomonadota bacterium]